MKTFLLQVSSSVLFICLIFLLLEGCKDTYNESNLSSYRLAGLLAFEGNVIIDSATYKYQGDRLSECVVNYNQYQDSIRVLYTYPDENSIVVTSNDTTSRLEYSFVNGKMTGRLLSNLINNSWEPQQQFTYQYQDGKLLEEIWYSGYDEGLRPDIKYTYEYEGDKIIRSRHYYSINSSWQEMSEEEAVYTGNLITRINWYTYPDSVYTVSAYTDLHYSGSLLTSRIYYISNTNEPDYSYVYTYDSDGNLVIQESPEMGDRIEYVYEKGKGNFRQIQQPGGGISGFVPLPWPTK